MRQGFPVTVAELLLSGGRPLPAEAAAIVLEICSKVTRATGPAVAAPISTSSVFVEADGSVSVAGGTVVEDDQTVSLLGHVLLDMLRSGQRPAARLEALGLRAAASGLRAAVSETSALNLARFAAEIRRFAPEDAPGAVRGLFERWRRGEHVPAAQDGRVPETLRRLLPEADLAAMAGLTPTLHGPGIKAVFAIAGRKLMFTAGTLLLLSVLGFGYFLWDGERRAERGGRPPSPASASVEPRAPRELLPSSAPAARPATPAHPPPSSGSSRPESAPRGRRDPARPN